MSTETEANPPALVAEPAHLPLPYDFPRVVKVPRRYQTVAVDLPVAEWIAPDNLALAGFVALIYRYTQQDVIPLGCSYPAVGPDSAAGQRMILSTSMVLDRSMSLRQLLQQATPLPTQSCASTAPQRPPNPVVAFGYWTQDGPACPGPDPSQPEVDLYLRVQRQGQLVQAWLDYAPDLFQTATVQRLAGHLHRLLAAGIAALDTPVTTLPLLTATEEQQFDQHWRSPRSDYPAQPLFRTLEQQASDRPTAIALRFRDRQLTYADLNRQANQLAHYLRQLGVGPGMAVASCQEPAPTVPVAMVAIHKLGAIYVPLDPDHPTDRLAAMLADTRPPVVLTQSGLAAALPKGEGRVVCLDQEWEAIARQPDCNPDLGVSLDQTAHIVYTSGTTGKPKGVMTSHGNLVNYIWSARAAYGFGPSDLMPAVARFTFSITMFELWSPLVAGGTLLLLDRDHILDPNAMVDTLQQVTVAHLSPSLLRRLVAHIDANGLSPQHFSQLRHISSGGDFVSADLLEAMKHHFPSAEVYVIYGCSEISCMGCTYLAPRSTPLTRSKVGRPFDNMDVYLLDPHRQRVPVGVVGEIYFGGAGVTQGYLNQPALTDRKFIPWHGQRLYSTGDLGRFDTEGNLELLGRSDYQIKLRGIRIEPGDIEATLRQSPGIRDSVVVARELPGRGEKGLVAYLVAEPGAVLDLRIIHHRLRTKLPDYMVPSALVVLDALPVNVNQKVDRQALPAPTQTDLVGFTDSVAPRTPGERQLVELWQELLGLSPIGIEHNFFDIGGNSLLAVELMTAIDATFGKALPLSTLLTAPTIAQLAAVLEADRDVAPQRSVVPIRPGGSRPPIFFIHDGEGETLLYRTLALALDADHPVYGVQPHSRDQFPMLHTRLSDIVTYYTEQIQAVQPQGPYLLGGLCIGGFIAFEIARRLRQQGEVVKLVALIDAAVVNLPIRPGLITQQRLTNLSQSLINAQQGQPWQRFLGLASTLGQKLFNAAVYEVTARMTTVQSEVRVRLLRYCLDQNLPLLPFLRHLSVTTILRFAEKEYVPGDLYEGEVLLFLATEKSSTFDGTLIDDTPYREIYSDPLLGWRSLAKQVTCYDIPGGHSSLLQRPNVDVLARAIQTYIDTPDTPLNTPTDTAR